VQLVKDKEFLELLGGKIRAIRKAQGLTQLELAVACNNYAEQIGRVERGELNVTVCSLKLIAQALNVKIAELFDF